MEANECRLNNVVNYRGQITTLTKNEMVHFYRFSEWYDPISLTEEILLKCGFKLYHSGSYCIDLFNENEYLAIDVKYNKGFVYLIIDDNSLKVNLEYLHQLQNLYFALTNTELQWNGSL